MPGAGSDFRFGSFFVCVTAAQWARTLKAENCGDVGGPMYSAAVEKVLPLAMLVKLETPSRLSRPLVVWKFCDEINP